MRSVHPRVSTVALIGPDGAGKTTVCRLLAEAEPGRFRYLYMGASRESSNVLLPTTRLAVAIKHRLGGRRTAGRRPRAPAHPSENGDRTATEKLRPLRSLKSAVSTANQIAEECYRQFLSWIYQYRGFVVLYDRHFLFDYTGHDVATRNETLARRLHVWWLQTLYPRPDLVMFLDVPADVLFRRKREGTPEALEERRRAHLAQLRGDPTIVRIDAAKPVEDVVEAIRTALDRGRAVRLSQAPR